MTPVVFINCNQHPFINDIINGYKQYETRTRNTLKSLVNKPVLIAETGNGKPVVKCSAIIRTPIKITSSTNFEQYRIRTRIKKGSAYDWNDSTKVKWLYPLENVESVPEFIPTEGIRHGRVWMEVE